MPRLVNTYDCTLFFDNIPMPAYGPLSVKSTLRCRLKLDRPISLQTLALDASLKRILGSGLDSNAGAIPVLSPNISAEQKQILSSHLKETLHRGLHKQLFNRVVENCYGASRISHLMDVLSDTCIGETVVDLIGPYRLVLL